MTSEMEARIKIALDARGHVVIATLFPCEKGEILETVFESDPSGPSLGQPVRVVEETTYQDWLEQFRLMYPGEPEERYIPGMNWFYVVETD